MKLKRILAVLIALGLSFGSTFLFAAEGEDYVIEEAATEVIEEVPMGANSGSSMQQNAADTDEFVIPNNPVLKRTNIITIRAIGMGVAPESTISPAQALVLAKRAAIADAYRQLGEKMYGIRINAKDTVKDAVIKSSQIRTQVNGLIRNAEIMETVYQDGLCQVEMELKLDGRRWYRVLSGY